MIIIINVCLHIVVAIPVAIVIVCVYDNIWILSLYHLIHLSIKRVYYWMTEPCTKLGKHMCLICYFHLLLEIYFNQYILKPIVIDNSYILTCNLKTKTLTNGLCSIRSINESRMRDRLLTMTHANAYQLIVSTNLFKWKFTHKCKFLISDSDSNDNKYS